MSKVENKIVRRRIIRAYLSSVVSISLVLLVVGIAALLLLNAGRLTSYLKENVKVSVLMKPEVTEGDAVDFQKILQKLPYVRNTEVISREQGEAEMAGILGEDFLLVFETSPIPVSVDVSLDAGYVSSDSLEVVRAFISKYEDVDDVVYPLSMVDALNANMKKISLALAVVVFLLLFISFVLISNTMRLTVYSDRFTIHTMKLVGATRPFIRGPFLLKSLYMGLCSAVIAVACLLGLVYYCSREFALFFNIFGKEVLAAACGIVLVSGVLICMISAFFVVNRLVALNKDELYY